jgi:hypothetical protein
MEKKGHDISMLGTTAWSTFVMGKMWVKCAFLAQSVSQLNSMTETNREA